MNKTKALIAVIVIAVVGFVASRFVPEGKDDILVPPTEPTTTKETVPTTSIPAPTAVSTSTYKDGMYSARGSYYSPEGLENITVKVTLKGGIITDTSAINEASDRMSVRFQDMFINNYKQYVVGKNINEVKLGKVSGSSLTGAGFNDALGQIKTQAQA